MASVRNSKQHLRGQYPAGHEPDLSPTRGRRAARGAAAGPGAPRCRGRDLRLGFIDWRLCQPRWGPGRR